MKILLAVLVIAAVVAATFGVAAAGNETGDMEFEEFKFGNTTVYWHQRQVGDAIVEGDYINRQIDTNSGKPKKNFTHWRDNLPDELPRNLTTEAEAFKTAGGGEYAKLYYLSPDSMIYRPAPETPVWIVWHAHEPDRWGNITVINAITGEFIASGIPPISTVPRPTPLPELPEPKVGSALAEAFIFTGPMYAGDPCYQGWYEFVDTVELYLTEMGYEIYRPVDYPTTSVIEQYLSNNKVAIFYEHCHGDVDYFWNSCGNFTFSVTTPEEIEAWLEGYDKIPFVFLANCNGMCGTGPGTLIDAFTKGSDSCVVVVGYCGMSYTRCRECAMWRWSWEALFFEKLAGGYTVEEAYNFCTYEYPDCEDCILYYGDPDLRLVPKISRCPVTVTFNSTSSDGQIASGKQVSYNVAHHSTTGTPIDENYITWLGQRWTGEWYYVNRCFPFFDTSSLPDGASIIDATLRLRKCAVFTEHTDFDVTIRNGQPTYPHGRLVSGDYDIRHYTSNDGGSKNSADFDSGYTDIPLTADGISWINKDGVTKLALISSRDYDDVAPTGLEEMSIYTYEAGAGRWPQLVVTYRMCGDSGDPVDPIVTSYVVGEVRDVNANPLAGVDIAIYKEGGSPPEATDISDPAYSLEVDNAGLYWMRASNDAYYTLNTDELILANRPTCIELLGGEYAYDFEGDYGLVPKACTMSYAMESVSHWLFVPIDAMLVPHPEWQLSNWKAMELVHSWQFPS